MRVAGAPLRFVVSLRYSRVLPASQVLYFLILKAFRLHNFMRQNITVCIITKNK